MASMPLRTICTLVSECRLGHPTLIQAQNRRHPRSKTGMAKDLYVCPRASEHSLRPHDRASSAFGADL